MGDSFLRGIWVDCGTSRVQKTASQNKSSFPVGGKRNEMLEVGTPNLMFPLCRARVDTRRPKVTPIRLSWLLRARPSATLHEIQGLLRRANLLVMLPGRGAVRQGFLATEWSCLIVRMDFSFAVCGSRGHSA